jgi:hypothetical protein
MKTPRTDFMLQLPTDWTPEQALAVHDILVDVAETIWQHYDEAMLECLQSEPDQHDAQPDLFGFDDPIRF